MTDVSKSVLPRNLPYLRNQLIKSWADSEATPWKLIKILGFSSDPVKNHEATNVPNKHSMLGQHRSASEMPFKWRFAGAQMLAHFMWYLDPLFSLFKFNITPRKQTVEPLTGICIVCLCPTMCRFRCKVVFHERLFGEKSCTVGHKMRIIAMQFRLCGWGDKHML